MLRSTSPQAAPNADRGIAPIEVAIGDDDPRSHGRGGRPPRVRLRQVLVDGRAVLVAPPARHVDGRLLAGPGACGGAAGQTRADLGRSRRRCGGRRRRPEPGAHLGYLYTALGTDVHGFVNISQGAFSAVVAALFAHNIPLETGKRKCQARSRAIAQSNARTGRYPTSRACTSRCRLI
jgi:hypothetical protein